jgi:hypothetical protein
MNENQRKCEDFGYGYALVQADFEFEEIMKKYVPDIGERKMDYTGLIIKIGEGEHREIWGTRDSIPYSLTAVYDRLK